MDRPPTQLNIKRDEGHVQVTFTPGLTVDQWAQTVALQRPMTRSEFDEHAHALAQEWGVQVAIDPPSHSST